MQRTSLIVLGSLVALAIAYYIIRKLTNEEQQLQIINKKNMIFETRLNLVEKKSNDIYRALTVDLAKEQTDLPIYSMSFNSDVYKDDRVKYEHVSEKKGDKIAKAIEVDDETIIDFKLNGMNNTDKDSNMIMIETENGSDEYSKLLNEMKKDTFVPQRDYKKIIEEASETIKGSRLPTEDDI